MSLQFDGKDELIRRIDAVVDGDCAKTITQCVRDVLCELMDQHRLTLPETARCRPPDHYARRLIHKDPERGYTIMAMTWGPGQATPVHDHSGMWCVEAVWEGQIEVTQYELTDVRGDRYRLEPRTTMRAGFGSAGTLIPPHEYHTIRNPCPDRIAVTIHIYAGEMCQCSVFEPEQDHWYRKERRALQLDAA
ncbi:MAG: cysteine dioxygenase family protein [Wenzhouxiangellaceae bacterium]